jgi:hypothetical protein
MRAVLFLIALLSLFFGPWWVLLATAALVCLRYRAYEFLLLAAIADALWLPSGIGYGLPLMTIAALLILLIFEPLRRELFVAVR